MKCQEILKNSCYNFPQLKLMSSNVLFHLNSPKPKDIQFNFMYDKEKHKILTFEKQIFGIFAKKKKSISYLIIKKDAD